MLFWTLEDLQLPLSSRIRRCVCVHVGFSNINQSSEISLHHFCVLAHAYFCMWFKYCNCPPECPCEYQTAAIVSNPAQLPARPRLTYKTQFMGNLGALAYQTAAVENHFPNVKCIRQTDDSGSLRHIYLLGAQKSAPSCLRLLQGQLSFSVILLPPQKAPAFIPKDY